MTRKSEWPTVFVLHLASGTVPPPPPQFFKYPKSASFYIEKVPFQPCKKCPFVNRKNPPLTLTSAPINL